MDVAEVEIEKEGTNVREIGPEPCTVVNKKRSRRNDVNVSHHLHETMDEQI